MHEARTEQYVDQYLPHLRAAKDEAAQKSVLRLLILKVENDTRQRAFRMAQGLVNSIDSMNDGPPDRP